MSLPSASPTRVRYGVLGFACSLAMITYLDRACFGVAQGYLMEALRLDNISDLMPALAAFNIAYAVFEVPTGWRVRQDHPRRGLVIMVPAEQDHDSTLSWLLRAGAALSAVPLTGAWRAAVFVNS